MQTIVCLPCYNEEKSLPPLLDRFAAIGSSLPGSMRLVAVDDGSADKTQDVLRQWEDLLPLSIVVHERNRGLGPAIITGLKEALALSQDDDDVIVCMDADNTHDPGYIPSMLEHIDGGADIVIASRYQKGSREVGVPLFRRLLSRVARWVFALALPAAGVRDYTCGFRAYRAGLLRRAMDLFGDKLIERRGFACTDEILIKLSVLTDAIQEIPFVLRYDQKKGPSALPFWETVLATMKLIYHGRAMRHKAQKTKKASMRQDSPAD